jgi:putative DNA primase/helicase
VADENRPSVLAVLIDGISLDLKVAPRWGVWRLEDPDGRDWTKVPYSALTGRKASSINATDWTTFEAAFAYLRRRPDYDGLGFCLGDGWAGVDFDGCRNPETGEIAANVREWIGRFDSYTEVSPSGTGVKIFIRGRLPDGAAGNAKSGALGIKKVEVYDHARYFTVTGHRLER